MAEYNMKGRNEQKKNTVPGGKPPVAGAGSKLDPGKPDYRSASGYVPEENINSGNSGGKKGKVAEGGGQSSDNWAAEHNKLVGQGDFQKDPYRVRGGDFPVKATVAGNDQSGRSYGFSEGHNDLVSQSMDQEGPRHAEDDGPMTPVPGDRSRVVAAGFPIEINKGEGNSDTGEIGIPTMVNLQTGYIEGGDGGFVQYVPQDNVSVGKPLSITKNAGHVGQQR